MHTLPVARLLRANIPFAFSVKLKDLERTLLAGVCQERVFLLVRNLFA